MKRVLALAIAPLLASAVFTGTAIAGGENKVDAGADAHLQGSADTGASGAEAGATFGADTDAELDTGTTASTGQPNFGSVISAIQSSGNAASDIEAVTDASEIEIVRVSDIAKGESMNALDEALSRNQAQVDELHTALEANAAISQHLEQEQVQVDDVVATESTTDGALRVYVR